MQEQTGFQDFAIIRQIKENYMPNPSQPPLKNKAGLREAI